MTKLHKLENAYGISTDRSDEKDFLADFANLLNALINSKPESAPFSDHDLAQWTKCAVDICCKLRGYKNEVLEKHWLFAGESMPTDQGIAWTDVNSGTGVRAA